MAENSSPEERDKQLSATVAALIGIAPKDELEGMMAAQLVAAHNAAMECYRRAMIGEQTLEGRRENLAQANKLSRTYAALLEALNRHRGKGQQKVTVEHVHVHAGDHADHCLAVFVLCEGSQLEVRRRDSAAAESDNADGEAALVAPMHGRIVALEVAPGDFVEKGQRLAAVEAMKMEHALIARRDGVIAEVPVVVGDQVAQGQTLIVLAPLQPEAASG